MPCPHPPNRNYCGFTLNPYTLREELWIACCDCGQLLKDAQAEPKASKRKSRKANPNDQPKLLP